MAQGGITSKDLTARAKSILAHYFFTPSAAITIENIDRILTEENARSLDCLIKAGIIFRELAPERGDDAVRYSLTEAGSTLLKEAPDEWIGPHDAFELTEPATLPLEPPLYSLTRKIILEYMLEDKRVEPHDPDDPEDCDVIYLDEAVSELSEGRVITVQFFPSFGDFQARIEGAHKIGGWPTYWSSIFGKEADVLESLKEFYKR
ncbi:MAG: hypothetical protein ABJN42_09835 [Roseibium sp.]|uniref:hypothetical protein n=1 Tax=Roseibium sp. TaxID=1936156 RepID=UPI0032976F77